jgi:signal transduction histidine kinase
MSRRLLGPVGGPVVFFLVAALVFAGLGWVTHSALKVEQAQREAHARAEIGNGLRDALWRLDGRVLLSLGVEDSRPVYHYDSADPSGAYGPAATPLLVATLPDWMRLHFQLDPVGGWRSNQAPDDPKEAERIREAWGGLPLRNFYAGREEVLAELKAKLPVQTTCETFAACDRAAPADSLPLAAPLFAEVAPNSQPEFNTSGQPQPPSPYPQAPLGPNPPSPGDQFPETVRLFGYELCPSDARQQAILPQVGNSIRPEPETPQKKAEPQAGKLGQSQMAQNPGVVMRGGRAGQKDAESDRGWLDYANRLQTFSKGLGEAKGAYDAPLARNYTQNALQNQSDFRNLANSGPTGPGGTGDEKDNNSYGRGGPPRTAPAAGGGFGSRGPTTRAFDPGPGLSPQRSSSTAFNTRSLLASLLEPARQSREDRTLAKDSAAHRELAEGSSPAGDFGWFWRKPHRGTAGGKPTGTMLPPAGGAGSPPPAVPAVTAAPLPAGIPTHLGSMRPQWVAAPDGTDMLVLVRSVRFDNRAIYQGVVLDWPKLQEELKAQVRDLFPDARLVPVKNPDGVSPGRAMAALPVQLDVGPEPEPPPAGWTPLRIGLVMAWAAALIAVVAVGFSGWSLIDLAERRIRFVSAVTHELRTPLTSLRLYLDLLVSGMIQDEAKRQEYLKTLTIESDRLHRLIDNVLDFARLEKRRKDGDVRPVKVAELLDLLRATWADRVAQDGKELVVMSLLPAGCEVDTDPAMIQQIVGNLIDNARKYTRDAAEKRIWLWAKPGRGKGVVLEVEDRGQGVAAGERRSIFKPFRRGHRADSTAGGAGLGLALAKSWAEVLGGRLTYRPADGGTGACFRLELPGK